MSRQTLEQLLVQTQLIGPVQLAIAQRDAQVGQKRLAAAVIDLGLVGDRRFAEWISKVSGAPLLDPLPDADVDRLRRRLPRAIAREYMVVPVGLEGDELTVATINPLDGDGLGVLSTATGLKIRLVVGVYGELTRLLSRYYPEDEIEATMLPSANATFGVADPVDASQTIAFAPAAPESPLESLQRQLESLERRVEAMESLLRRVVPPRE